MRIGFLKRGDCLMDLNSWQDKQTKSLSGYITNLATTMCEPG
jgi:hypothetical protein